MSAFRILLITILFLGAAGITRLYSLGEQARVGDQKAVVKVRNGLEALAMDRGEWKDFTVTYDDLHPFHGGLTLTIFGTGDGEQKILFPSRPPVTAGRTRNVSSIDLKHLVNLLVAHKAWEQRVPERTPVPDESRSYLVIRYGNDATTIWEWYNDMPQNKRIIEIREFMKKVALSQ